MKYIISVLLALIVGFFGGYLFDQWIWKTAFKSSRGSRAERRPGYVKYSNKGA